MVAASRVGRADGVIHDAVDHPHAVWWFAVIGGLTLLAFQGFDARFYAWYTRTLHWLPSQAFMRWLFIACVPIHVFEAVYAYRTARRVGMDRSALGWAVQCFFLGYPSTRLLMKRVSKTA